MVSQPDVPLPMEPTPMPDSPWQELALDFLGPFPFGKYLLVIVDYYSRYFNVKISKAITTEKVIAAMEQTIDKFGILYYE